MLGENDGAETAPPCNDLSRWSSALEDVELEIEGTRVAGVGRRAGGIGYLAEPTHGTPTGNMAKVRRNQKQHRGHLGFNVVCFIVHGMLLSCTNNAVVVINFAGTPVYPGHLSTLTVVISIIRYTVPSALCLLKNSEDTASREDYSSGEQNHGRARGSGLPVGKENSSGNHIEEMERAGGDALESDRRGARPPLQVASKPSYRRNRNISPENTDGWDSEGGQQPRALAHVRHASGMRGDTIGNGHARPTPSYALPTKHFKTLTRYTIYVAA